MSSKMLNDSFFRRSPNCSKFSLLLASKDPEIRDYNSPQIITGKELTEEYILQNGFDYPILIKESKDSIDLKVPNNVKSLSDIAKIIGSDFQVKIIDVGSQHEIDGWTISDYAQFVDFLGCLSLNSNRYLEQRGKMHKVLNMITLEASATPLTSQLLAPGVVRNLDWIDMYWPFQRRARGADYPRVQKYVLAGMGGSYTDFHVDFGGTSVWYHVLVGEKVFYIIPPSEANLRAYCNWITSANQESVFLPDTLSPGQCQRLTIKAGQTLFLPSGWIHSVYTPIDSLVYGGNFLFSSCILRQLQIYQLEVSSRVPRKYLFPYYKQMAWYAVCCSLQTQRYNMKNESTLPPPYPSILSHPRIVYQWIYLIKVCEIWINSKGQLVDDKSKFEEIAADSYEIPTNPKEISHLPQQIIEDWWGILESHNFQMRDPVPGVLTPEEYNTSIHHHIQRIREIPLADFDILNESTFASYPFHTTFENFGSETSIPVSEATTETPTTTDVNDSKPEVKIRLKLSTPTSSPSDVPLKDESSELLDRPIPQIKLKLTLPPPPSSRSRKATSSSSPKLEVPLSRTRGKRLPLSFLQSVTDIDVLPPAARTATDQEQVGDTQSGVEETWKDEEEEDDDFLNDAHAREQIRADDIEDYLDDDEYEQTKSKSKKRRVESNSDSDVYSSASSMPRKSKQKLGPGALLRKKLSGKYM